MADLFTTRQVQELLQVDRTTIYRMVQAGQIPALRVGKQWRFARADIERWLKTGDPAASLRALAPDSARADSLSLAELLPLECVQSMQDAFAEALGVMMVVTDMDGQPVTSVSNLCGLYEIVLTSGTSVALCIAHWQQMAGELALGPRFAPNEMGLLCARGLIRSGKALKGMLFLGGIAPDAWPPTDEELKRLSVKTGLPLQELVARIGDVYTLERAARERVLTFAQRIADILSHIIEERHALTTRLQAIASLSAF